jgi:hypothetical protein
VHFLFLALTYFFLWLLLWRKPYFFNDDQQALQTIALPVAGSVQTLQAVVELSANSTAI